MVRITKNKDLEPVTLLCAGPEACTAREFLSKISDKWSILIIVILSKQVNHSARFGELQKMINGISQRMLTTTLRNLERDGLVSREVFPEVPPRVEYQLTNLGLGLIAPMKNLMDWIGINWNTIKKSREGFDSKRK
jgi:DNA-binding HxlR family transcriptional regulator